MINFKPPTALAFKNYQQLIAAWPSVQRSFLDRGFILLKPIDAHRETFLKVASLFGKIQGHPRASSDGIVEIRSQAMQESSVDVISNIAFSAHTDGSYLEGIAQKLDQTYQITAPKIVALQCVQPAYQGGKTFLVDGQKILRDMVYEQPKLANFLAVSGMFTICRGGYIVTNTSIFYKISPQHYAMRFSYDNDIYGSSYAMKMLALFDNAYVRNPLYTTSIKLAEREILVFDNQRLLHGRSAVHGARWFRRIWVQNDTQQLHNPKIASYFPALEHNQLIFKRFEPYLPCDVICPFSKTPEVSLGIKLSLQEQRLLHI